MICGAGSNAVVGIAELGIVNISARTLILLHSKTSPFLVFIIFVSALSTRIAQIRSNTFIIDQKHIFVKLFLQNQY